LPKITDVRFTPTGVGTTSNRRSAATNRAVHPHGRGDNASGTVRDALQRGSPPRAWGQSLLGVWVTHPTRFTPTGVGTISPRMPHQSSISVHPHGRGDNRGRKEVLQIERGSPPRAWGQCRVLRSVSMRRWFTPTGVGTIYASAPVRSPRAVHPHGRGDNLMRKVDVRMLLGSPPRAWGQLIRLLRRLLRRRFTPTGVGTMPGACLMC